MRSPKSHKMPLTLSRRVLALPMKLTSITSRPKTNSLSRESPFLRSNLLRRSDDIHIRANINYEARGQRFIRCSFAALYNQSGFLCIESFILHTLKYSQSTQPTFSNISYIFLWFVLITNHFIPLCNKWNHWIVYLTVLSLLKFSISRYTWPSAAAPSYSSSSLI